MATLLSDCKSLRLALLNACQGATPSAASAFAGVAQKLIQQGTPAVIAMQAPIVDDHAIRFAQEFYRAWPMATASKRPWAKGANGSTKSPPVGASQPSIFKAVSLSLSRS
ncbi:MAG: CHAT domain-containing protein [Anaerolineae bacterium]|nr:CHAT domain-containing protein [Anaerolineae bacterium]